MKIIKKLLAVIAGIIVLFLIVALFVKKDYSVKREITINKPTPEVFNFVKYLKNQDLYSKWAMMDPNMKKEYRGTDGTVGFVSAWESNVDGLGKGEQEILKITEGQRLDLELRFLEPYETKDNAFMTTESTGDNQTRVTWGFNGRMNYPLNMMLLFMDMDEMIGGDLATGLENLKSVLEKQ